MLLPFHGCIVVIFTVWSHESWAWGPCFAFCTTRYTHMQHTRTENENWGKVADSTIVAAQCSSVHHLILFSCCFGLHSGSMGQILWTFLVYIIQNWKSFIYQNEHGDAEFVPKCSYFSHKISWPIAKCKKMELGKASWLVGWLRAKLLDKLDQTNLR